MKEKSSSLTLIMLLLRKTQKLRSCIVLQNFRGACLSGMLLYVFHTPGRDILMSLST